MNTKVHLIFADTNEQRVAALQKVFEGSPALSALLLKPGRLNELVDALQVSLVYCMEHWGLRAITHRAQIVKTRSQDENMPPYIISGVAMSEDDPRDARFELQLLISGVLDAVNSFNAENDEAIRSIGFWTSNDTSALSAAEAGRIIRSTYEQKCERDPRS